MAGIIRPTTSAPFREDFCGGLYDLAWWVEGTIQTLSINRSIQRSGFGSVGKTADAWDECVERE